MIGVVSHDGCGQSWVWSVMMGGKQGDKVGSGVSRQG